MLYKENKFIIFLKGYLIKQNLYDVLIYIYTFFFVKASLSIASSKSIKMPWTTNKISITHHSVETNRKKWNRNTIRSNIRYSGKKRWNHWYLFFFLMGSLLCPELQSVSLSNKHSPTWLKRIINRYLFYKSV